MISQREHPPCCANPCGNNNTPKAWCYVISTTKHKTETVIGILSLISLCMARGQAGYAPLGQMTGSCQTRDIELVSTKISTESKVGWGQKIEYWTDQESKSEGSAKHWAPQGHEISDDKPHPKMAILLCYGPPDG